MTEHTLFVSYYPCPMGAGRALQTHGPGRAYIAAAAAAAEAAAVYLHGSKIAIVHAIPPLVRIGLRHSSKQSMHRRPSLLLNIYEFLSKILVSGRILC